MIAQARHPWARRPDFPRDVDAVARLYASRGDAPIWLAGRRLSPAGRGAVVALFGATEEGLSSADYDAATLDGLARGLPHPSWNALALARFDLSLTVALVRYLDDLRGRRIRPGPFGTGRVAPGIDLAAAVAGAASGDSVATLVTTLEPRLAQYRNLRRHLARYRALAADTPFVSRRSASGPSQRHGARSALHGFPHIQPRFSTIPVLHRGEGIFSRPS